MDVHPAVDEHWPHLAALVRTLQGLDNRTGTTGDLAAEGRRIQLALDAYQQRVGRR